MLVLAGGQSAAHAQNADAATPVASQDVENAASPHTVTFTSSEASALERLQNAATAHLALNAGAVLPGNMKTLFFTAWQYALLVETRENVGNHPVSSNPRKSSGPREISLGGISYRNARNWTVWLNSQRVKPDALPPQVLSFDVTRDHVDMKWLDDSSSLIYPIRLHPHERFNLDDRIFLPGPGLGTPANKSGT